MTDEEILREHIRVRVAATRIFIEVRSQEGSDAMATRWRLAAALPLASPHLHVDRVRLMTASDYRYFRVCDTCGVKHPAALVRSVGDGTDICPQCDA